MPNKHKIVNILYIGNVYPTIHGAALTARYIAEYVSNENVKIDILNTVFNNDITTIEKSSPLKAFKLLRYVAEFLVIITTKKVDTILLTHSLGWPAFYKDMLFVQLALLFNKRIILYAQGVGFDTLFYNKLSPQRQKFIDKIFKKVSEIVVVSYIQIQEYERWIAPKNIHVIYNICEPLIDKNKVVNRSGRENISILFLSAVIQAKGIFILLEAFQNLREKYANLRLVVCGRFMESRAEDRANFEKFIKVNSLADVIEVRGPVSGEDKINAFLEADIFVLPSLRESFGIVNIEAMSAGLPVVSTIQGAIPEYVTEGINGFLVPSGDVAELEKKIEMLILNPELRNRMGEKNREDFFANFTRENFQKLWRQVLTKDSGVKP